MDDKSLLVMISSPPYTIGAVDGMLTVLGVRPKLGWDVNIFLIGDGVFLAKRGQEATSGVYAKVASAHGISFNEVNFERALRRLIQEGVKVYANKESCRERRLNRSEIVENVAIANDKVLARELMRAKVSFFF